MRDYVASRPVVAELEAIARAIAFAGETGCALHIVHVSSGRGVALVAEARGARRRRDLRDLPALPRARPRRTSSALGALAKCAPPLRDAAERDGAVARARAAARSTWSPPTTRRAPPELKAGRRFAAWGGISGCQTTARLLLAEGLAPSELARLCAAAPGRRFGLPGGRMEPGADADLLLLDPAPTASAERRRALLPPPQQPVRGPHPARARSRARCCAAAPWRSTAGAVGEPRGQLRAAASEADSPEL